MNLPLPGKKTTVRRRMKTAVRTKALRSSSSVSERPGRSSEARGVKIAGHEREEEGSNPDLERGGRESIDSERIDTEQESPRVGLK